MNWLGLVILFLLIAVTPEAEAGFLGRMVRKTGNAIKKVTGGVGRMAGKIGRKILDLPPKNRSRFDKYPVYIMRYHLSLWKQHFSPYLNDISDGRPLLPKPDCWSVKCWVKRTVFETYWKFAAKIPSEGKNSAPFLHRRCRIPHFTGFYCKNEHLRHDYYWRMFMWVGRNGFPTPPPRKSLCISEYCRRERKFWENYWTKFFIYTSLIPVIRPYDYTWKYWMWRYQGSPRLLQEIAAPALIAIGQGFTMNPILALSQPHMTIEMKRALLTVSQFNLFKTMQIVAMSRQNLLRQQLDLILLMRMPALPASASAQIQMQVMMQNMRYQQSMQQYQTNMLIRQQMYNMAQYLRGSCGCNACSGGSTRNASGIGGISGVGGTSGVGGIGSVGGITSGMGSGMIPSGSSMYIRNANGQMNSVNSALMNRQMSGLGGLSGGIGYPGGGIMSHSMSGGLGVGGGINPIMPNGYSGASRMSTINYNSINNPMDLRMRAQSIYSRNNLPGFA